MDAIEKAIRSAFEKGDADDRAFREKVYRSAFAALDRALQANPGITVENAIKRRKAMQAKISEIESEFLPAVAPTVADADVQFGNEAPSVDAPGSSAGPAPSVDGRREPSLAGNGPTSRVLPVVPDIIPDRPLPGSPSPEAAASSSNAVSPDRDPRRARRRFPTGTLAGVAVLAVIGVGVWWAVQSGMLKMPDGAGPSSATQASGAGGNDAAPQRPGEADDTRNWIDVFTPSDPTLVSAPSDAKADVMQDDSGSFLRIRSGSSGSAVSFDVGQGILEQIAGKHAVFDIVARAEDGKDTQISVDCNFGELGNCGRKRYAVGHEKNEYLFDVGLPDVHPGAAGTIAISSDFDKQGKSVDIYQIRVSVVE